MAIKFQVTVKAEGKPDHTVVVEASSEGKARSQAMMTYPYPLRGQLVEYVIA
jgi:hypothetical protein